MLPSVATPFTPFASLFGGVLIGLSAVIVLLLFGRIAGISGITSAGLLTKASDWLWRLFFLAGLVLAPLMMSMLGLEQWGIVFISELHISENLVGMALAGLAVGVGTVLGSGCTSGHGVCGLGRLSARSLVAVVVFMATAATTVFVLRHVLG